MHILHSGSLDIKSGGPALSTYLSLKGVRMRGHQVGIIMPPLNKHGKIIAEDIEPIYTKPVINNRFGYIPDIRKTLNNIAPPDIYHVQGIWQYLGHSVARHARLQNRPYVVTLRGMLYPQALSKSKFIKRVSLALYQKKDLACASAIQCTCFQEMEYYRQLGFKNPVAIIPNPIETTNFIDKPVLSPDIKRFGYLGRLHPRKRVERLLYAFHNLADELCNCELLIIGGGDTNYEQFLKKETKRLGLTNVRFTGFLSGESKNQAINSLSWLVVPSDFENFGNIVTESLVRGIPVIASKGTPWQELETNDCGMWIDNNQEAINAAIQKASRITEQRRLELGIHGKRLMIEKYSIENTGIQLEHLYQWILGEKARPEFVYY